MFPDASV